MPEYFDSKSSKPKKTKKTRYAGRGGIETYNSQIQRKYHGGSVTRKQAGSKIQRKSHGGSADPEDHGGWSTTYGEFPGGIKALKKSIASIKRNTSYTPASLILNIAKAIRKQSPGRPRKRVPGGNSAGGSVKRK